MIVQCYDEPTDNAAAVNEEPKPKKPRKKSSKQLLSGGERISDNISLCDDGKYRWQYDLHLFKNPTVFLLVWKIFFFILLGIFVFIFFISLGDGKFFPEGFLSWLKALGIAIGVMTAVVFLGYALYAAIMGGKYCVIFEMDEKGINHKQIPAQAKKAKKIAGATVAAGLMTGRFSTVGAGIAASRTEMYSDFAKVGKVKAYPRRDLIKVNEGLFHNQVYVKKEDFEFVKGYIVDHCVKIKENQ